MPICKECGKEFDCTDKRRRYCDDCLLNGNSPKMKQHRYVSAYVKRRTKNDAQFAKRREEQSKRYFYNAQQRRYRELAIQATKYGQDIDALTAFLSDNFQLRHK